MYIHTYIYIYITVSPCPRPLLINRTVPTTGSSSLSVYQGVACPYRAAASGRRSSQPIRRDRILLKVPCSY